MGCSPRGREESDTTERLHFHFSPPCIGEGNGNPLQCSCLENPRDRGAWWASVYRVIQRGTRLKRLSSSSSSSSSSNLTLHTRGPTTHTWLSAKTTSTAKGTENTILTIAPNSGMAQMLELSDRESKITTFNILRAVKEKVDKILQEMSNSSRGVENLRQTE